MSEIIRKIEQEVLDVEYRRFPAINFPDELAITRILKVAGDITRDEFPGSPAKKLSPLSRSGYYHHLTRALSHALRWILTDCRQGEAVPTTRWATEDNQTADLLLWAMNFTKLATDHVAWSNALIDATADTDTKTIKFHPPSFDQSYYIRQAEAEMDWMHAALVESYPRDSFIRLFNDWQREVEWSKDGLHFSPSHVKNHPEFRAILEWTNGRTFPELPDNTPLGAYSLGDARLFYACLQTISFCVRTLEDELDRRTGAINEMGTWTFQAAESEMIDWLRKATDLSVAVIQPLVADLTLNPSRFHCSITTTPFVRSKSGRHFILPRLFASLEPQRSLTSALTTGTGRAAYDRISTCLESRYLQEIAKKLRRSGLNVIVETEFRASDGSLLKPDLVITDNSTTNLVVADFKNALAATGSAEVVNRLKVYRGGVNQVRRYVEYFRTHPDRCPGSTRGVASISGLLLFRLPMPLPIQPSNEVHVEDWFSLETRLRGMKSAKSIDVLPKKAISETQYEIINQIITVQDWNYDRAVLFLPDAKIESLTSGGCDTTAPVGDSIMGSKK